MTRNVEIGPAHNQGEVARRIISPTLPEAMRTMGALIAFDRGRMKQKHWPGIDLSYPNLTTRIRKIEQGPPVANRVVSL